MIWKKETIAAFDYDFSCCRSWADEWLALCIVWELERELGSGNKPFQLVDPEKVQSLDLNFAAHVVYRRPKEAKPVVPIELGRVEIEASAANASPGIETVRAFRIDWSFDPQEIIEALTNWVATEHPVRKTQRRMNTAREVNKAWVKMRKRHGLDTTTNKGTVADGSSWGMPTGRPPDPLARLRDLAIYRVSAAGYSFVEGVELLNASLRKLNMPFAKTDSSNWSHAKKRAMRSIVSRREQLSKKPGLWHKLYSEYPKPHWRDFMLHL